MLSIVCPVYNEEKYIRGLLDQLLRMKPAAKELIFIDGGSTDNTVQLLKEHSLRNENVIVLNNRHRYVPYALNMGIMRAKGEIIVRVDAHTEYADDYLQQIIDTFATTPADIVGGPMRARGENDFQRAVAFVTSTPMGIGNSRFHFEEFNGYTDSVYLGAWKKSVFQTAGLFDEQMKRNQDDEFHYRAKSLGLKIYQNSQIRSYYHPRDTAGKLARQYFEYGLYKPLVLYKIRSELKARHLIPACFVLYLASILVVHHFLWYIPLLLYLAGAVYYSVNNSLPLASRMYSFVSFWLIHTAYGSGFLLGLRKVFQKKPKKIAYSIRQVA